MKPPLICDGIRTPVGRYGGSLASVRADDLAALPIAELIKRNPSLAEAQFDDVVFGAANQSGEDNRNVARMAALLAGLPESVPGSTINRLCGSGMNAIGIAANAIAAGEADLMLAGGAESMTRAPFVMGKSDKPFGRAQTLEDTTMGWRFVNPKLKAMYGVDTMPQTAENLAVEYGIERAEQDEFALLSQEKAKAAIESGAFNAEITSVEIKGRKGAVSIFEQDEHPRATDLETLGNLRTIFEGGTITAGNASGINDGAAALVIASENGAKANGLTPRARILGSAVAGVPPRTMGIGPVPAVNKLLQRLDLSLDDFDLIELNEAFAAQSIACLRDFGLSMSDSRLNPNGGAIALGHPLGMSGARLVLTALNQLEAKGGKRALCTMCIGVGQGIAMAIERLD